MLLKLVQHKCCPGVVQKVKIVEPANPFWKVLQSASKRLSGGSQQEEVMMMEPAQSMSEGCAMSQQASSCCEINPAMVGAGIVFL